MAAATRTVAAANTLLSSHDAVQSLARQMRSLMLGRGRRNFVTGGRIQLEGQTTPPASSSDISAIINDTAPQLAASTSAPVPAIKFPSSPSTYKSTNRRGTPSQRIPYPGRHAGPGAPYRLHAHCTKHNTILALTRDLPGDQQAYEATRDAKRMLGDLESNKGVAETAVDRKILGQTVLRTSPGLLGLKKAQRGTFEAASRASVQMFDLIAQLGWVTVNYTLQLHH